MQNPQAGTLTAPCLQLLERQPLLDCVAEFLAAPHGPGRRFAFLQFNVMGFRQINGLYGHGAADGLQRELARRLLTVLTQYPAPIGWLAQLSVDEFGLFIPHLPTVSGVAGLARRLQRQLQQPVTIVDGDLTPKVLVGLVVGGPEALSLSDLLRCADYALAGAKSRRAGRQLFGHRQARQAARQLAVRRELPQVIRDGQLQAHYQPVLDGLSGTLLAVEALARWQHPLLGAVSPAEFIPVAEESELIERLGEVMLRESLTMLSRFPDETFKLHVNLSVRQLYRHDLVAMLADLLAHYQIAASRLVLEITESQLMADPDCARAQMARLKELGVWLALDDFGTGFAAMHSLIGYPLDILKLDRAFVRELETAPKARLLVQALAELSQKLGMTLVAEGVETPGQRDLLLALGVNRMQGFFFSPAVPAGKLISLLP